MNLDSLSFALCNISSTVTNLSNKNYKSSVQEVSRLVALYGLEAERHLIRCLFSHVDFSSDGTCGKDFHQAQYLIQECAALIHKPYFITAVCYAIDCPLQQQQSLRPVSLLLPQLSKVLKFSSYQEIAFGIALQHSRSEEVRQHAKDYLKEKFPKYLEALLDKESDLQIDQLTLRQLISLLSHLHTDWKEFGISEELKNEFLKAVLQSKLKDNFLVAKHPVFIETNLYSESDLFKGIMDNEGNVIMNNNNDDTVIQSIKELGSSFTASLEDCRNHSSGMNFTEPTPSLVAKILSIMARTAAGVTESPPQNITTSRENVIIWSDDKEKSDGSQTQGWNVEIFVQVVHEMMPNLDWKETVRELDNPSFIMIDRASLKLLWQALVMGLGHEPFPMDLMYRRWRNTEGQFSFFQHVLNCSDIVCLTDFAHRPVTIDALKSPPEEDNRAISNWKSLDLIETLLTLSDSTCFKEDIFKFPMNQCPDLLVLGLIQVNRTINAYHKELLSRLFPIFLNNHSNSAIIFHLAWHSQVHSTAIKNIIMQAMADWYIRGDYDQSRLSRILDVAQDLKALPLLLNIQPHSFVIDLACLASRREYLKLEKWMMDKINEHGEPFVKHCISFLRRRVPQIAGASVKDDCTPKSGLPTETLAVMLHVLKHLPTYAPQNVTPDLVEAIVTMSKNCALIYNSANPQNLGSVNPARGLESVLSSVGGTPTNNALESSTTSLVPSVGGLALGPNAKTNLSGNSLFSVSRDLHPFTSAPLGSPVKMLSVATPTTPVSSVNPINQSLSNLSSIASHIPSHFSNQLGSDLPDIKKKFPVEIEEKANSYFQRVYSHPPHPTSSIDDVLGLLKEFKESTNEKEKDVYNCMIRNLFEEYRYFPGYPEKELLITAQLFGGIIEHNLVNYMTLGVALRLVLDALKKSHGTKMFLFGVAALDKFKSRLKDYPQYCHYVANVPHFHEFPPVLIEYVEYGVRSQEPPLCVQTTSTLPAIAAAFPQVTGSSVGATTTTTVTVTSTTTKSTISGKPSIANATNIDTLLVATEKDDKLIIPPESVQDKVSFIVNNLSQSNLPQKTEEYKEIVKDEYWPWASQYLVMKRASIEPNFHSLYSNFLDTLKQPEVAKLVIRETFRNIKVLLRSDKGIANFSDRSLLKNLGHWLGMLTLAKSKPILQIDIDIKALLIEAYHNGQEELLYVVPFIAKVLESCAKSKVFKPPNPWTMGIMNSLAELHKEQDLKLNLKFEIEVLCKTLSLDINDLKPGNVLKDPEQANRLESQLTPLPKPKEQTTAAILPGIQQKPLNSIIGHSQNIMSTMPLTTEESMNVSVSISGSNPQSAMILATSTPVPASVPQPQFSYSDINTVSLSCLTQHVSINAQLALFQANPQLKQLIRSAIERAVADWISAVVERSVRIALTTTEQLIRKDFALDPDESRMRTSAHHMVRYLTAGMAMITCKDPLLMSINTSLKSSFLQAVRNPTQQQKEMVEQAAQIIAQDNIEAACCFVQKSAIERALSEIDKRLATEYELRKLARTEGRRYCDAAVLTYQAERMPEQIRMKVGSVPPQQMAVYEEFAKVIPGFLPPADRDHANFKTPLPVIQSYASDEVVQIYDKVISELEIIISSTMIPGNVHFNILHRLLEAVMLARASRDAVSGLSLLQKVIEGLFEGLCHIDTEPEILRRFREGHLLVLKALSDHRLYGHQWTCKHITHCLIECHQDVFFNLELIDLLIRNHLIDLPSYDSHLAQLMEKDLNNYMAISFAMQFVKLYLIKDRQSGLVTETDIPNTFETLVHLANARQGPDGLSQLMDVLRTASDAAFLDRAPGPSSMMHSGITQAREYNDPPGLHEKTEYLLREWVNMYHSPSSGRDSTKAFSMFVHQMNLQGILKTDELITRFFRLSTEMCVDLCYRAQNDQSNNSPSMIRAKCFHTIDAFVRLIALLVKHSGDTSNSVTKLNLLNKVLGIVAGVLLHDQEMRGENFHQLAYHRILIMLFLELSTPDPVLDAISTQITHAFANTFYFIRPNKAPGFAYAWLELISHRVFLGRMLSTPPQPKVQTPSVLREKQLCWSLYAHLLIVLFKFLAPFLRNVELPPPINLLYKGTLRVLLVLLHDFPEFLCDYHYHLCDSVASNCIQIRNLILSAFPRNMHLPDPFTSNFKVDLLADIKQPPRMIANFGSAILPANFKEELDSYIKTRSPVTFLSDLRSNLQVSTEPGMKYNNTLINALVLYVGTQAINYIQNKGSTPNMSTITHSSHMDIFQNLAVDLDTEGRYLFFNAIANQLRYPNSHTHYFSCTLLYLFAEANTEAIQEQITRVLLERLIVNRPHPWGLLVTFIELIKNQTFKFWNHEFVHCAPEVEKLVENVARSCMHPRPSVDPSSA